MIPEAPLPGENGRDGADGADGVNTARPWQLVTLSQVESARAWALGRFSPEYDHPTFAGRSDQPGGGGGGGGNANNTIEGSPACSQLLYGGCGGAGGAGGVAGKGGGGGGHGGHSIAIVSGRPLEVRGATSLVVGNGGDGAIGGIGNTWTFAHPSKDGCPGANGLFGGNGGRGGNGGAGDAGYPGAGGSVAAVLTGPDTEVLIAPTVDIYLFGTFGHGAPGATGALKAPDGVTSTVLRTTRW